MSLERLQTIGTGNGAEASAHWAHVANVQACLNRVICSIRREIYAEFSYVQLKLEADGCSYTRPILHLSLRGQEDLLLYDRDSHPEEPTKVVSLFHVIL